MIDMCSECYSWPCLCIYTNFTAFIVGEESSQFIGIKNIDQNNCFLSTALQALLNTNSFSQVLSAHNSTKDKSIISCLKSIYKTMELCKYNKSSKKIDLYLYRNKLAEICGNEKLGENMQGDAMEIIETILLYMHKASKKSIEATDASSSECTGPCYAHFICNNIIDEIHECSCAKSLIKNNSSVEFIIRLNFASFVSDVPLELIHRFRENFYSELPGMYQKSFMKNKIGTLPTIIAKELGVDEKFEECSLCKNRRQMRLKLRSSPKLMIFQVLWQDYYSPSLIYVLQVLLSLTGKIELSQIFEGTNLEVGLKGMIVYLNNHYVYFGIGEDFRWYRVDDDVCQTVGIGRWYDVILILIFMKGLPVGLIYEENFACDLTLYQIETLYLENVVYVSSLNQSQDAGTLELYPEHSINPVKYLASEKSDRILDEGIHGDYLPDHLIQETFYALHTHEKKCRNCSRLSPDEPICNHCKRNFSFPGFGF